MAPSDIVAYLFMALNILRVIAYLPQIIAVWRDEYGATAVSIATWVLFTATNGITVVYAEIALEDRMLSAFFALNAFFCLAIAALTIWKRYSRSNAFASELRDQPRFQAIALRKPGGGNAEHKNLAL